ncbi:MAG: hypothetical protein QXN55_01665 [Candidatus Nitrosotenuis sp.]
MKTNEMYGDFATLSYPVSEPVNAETAVPAELAPETAVADPTEISPNLEGEILAYPLEVTMINADEQWLYLALTLNVSVENQSVKIIKKLKVCKESLRNDFLAELNKPATVVESMTAKTDISKRLRELAGIPHKRNFI